MPEFAFRAVITYRSAQAFIDEDLERVHDRLNKRAFDALVAEFRTDDSVIVEVEPV